MRRSAEEAGEEAEGRRWRAAESPADGRGWASEAREDDRWGEAQPRRWAAAPSGDGGDPWASAARQSWSGSRWSQDQPPAAAAAPPPQQQQQQQAQWGGGPAAPPPPPSQEQRVRPQYPAVDGVGAQGRPHAKGVEKGCKGKGKAAAAAVGGGGGPLSSQVDAAARRLQDQALQAGRCVCLKEIKDTLQVQFQTQRVPDTGALVDLAKLEQAIRQFLHSHRAHGVIWCVRDMEASFLRSALQKKGWDVGEWTGLRIGPTLAQHPVLSEVFPEFLPLQQVLAESAQPPCLVTGAEVLESFLQYRNDVGFKSEVQLSNFLCWYAHTKGAPLEHFGACFNERKIRLVFAGQNAALSERARLRRTAEANYLKILSGMTQEEVEEEAAKARDPPPGAAGSQAQAERFLQQWRRTAAGRPVGEVRVQLALWARHVLDTEPPPYVATLSSAFAAALKQQWPGEAEAVPPSPDAPAAVVPLRRGPAVSPLEVAQAVRSHLDALPDGVGLDIEGLLKLEEAVAGSAGSVEALIGGSLLRLVVDSQELRDRVDRRLRAGAGGAAAAGAGAGAGGGASAAALAAAALEVLSERPPRSAVLDVRLAAELERRLRVRLGAAAVADWGGHGSLAALLADGRGSAGGAVVAQGWALAVEDCEALALWQRHAARVRHAGGDAVAALHFGRRKPVAAGLPPQARGVVEPEPGTQSCGLCYEAAAIARLRATRRPQASTQIGATDEELEAAAAEADGEEVADAAGEPAAGLLGAKDAEAAFLALQAVPFLEDVEATTSWNEVFAPSLGPLADFVASHPESGRLAERGLRFLAVAPGALASAKLTPQLLRIPVGADSDELRRAAESADARLAAALLATMCVDDPRDVAALGYHLKVGLEHLASRLQGGVGVRAAFCVAVLSCLPMGLCEAGGRLAVLPAMSAEAGWVANAAAAAGRLGCTRLLAILGAKWDIPEWAALLTRAAPFEAPTALLARACGLASGGAASEADALLLEQLQGAGAGAAGATQEASEQAGSSEPSLAAASPTAELARPLGRVRPATITATRSALVAAGEEWAPKAGPREPLGEHGDVLEDIRSGFLLDNINASQLQLNLGGSLQRLGDDLYREQHHFVFELLQNATDCVFPEGEVPRFKLVLQDSQLVALSNEVGFREADVRALCAVDSSTKPGLGQDGRQRIGRKGIGFKSVFKITDTPIIHSGPWHFRFDALLPSPHGVNLKGLGYIVPEPVPDTDRQFEGWTTEIRLPFKKGLGEEERAHLQRDLEALSGALLLNLTSLRRIELLDSTSGAGGAGDPAAAPRLLTRADLYEKRDDSLTWRIVEIGDGAASRHWFSVDHSFCFAGQGREDVHITLSFPLPDKRTTREWLREELPVLPTYCYLPLRAFGWRVALHANFDVTASRNEIHDNSPWNVKIKSSLPHMFVLAMQLAKKHLFMAPVPAAPGDEAQVRDALQENLTLNASSAHVRRVPYSFIFRFVPLPGTLGQADSDFFRGMEVKIWQRLRSERCVLSSDGEWVEPTQALQAPAGMQEVISSDMLRRHCDGLRFLHPECEGIAPEAARQLGMRGEGHAFGALMRVAQGVVDADEPQGSDIVWLQRVLALAYGFVFGDGIGAEDSGARAGGLAEASRDRLAKLRGLRILPVADEGPAVAPRDIGVFMPSRQDMPGLLNRLVRALGMRLIDPRIVEGASGEVVRRLLAACELRELSPPALLVDGVLPFLQGLRGRLDAPSLATLADCLALLAKHRTRFRDCDALLRARSQGSEESFEAALRRALTLPCWVNGELRAVAAGSPMLLPSELHRRLAAEARDEEARKAHEVLAEAAQLLPDAPHLDDALLQGASEGEVSVLELADFLRDAGASLGAFPVVEVLQRIESLDALEEVALGGGLDVPEGASFPAELRDWVSPALAAGLERSASGGPAAVGAQKLIAASYTLDLRDRLLCKVTFQGGLGVQGHSSVHAALKNTAWVPCEGSRTASPAVALLPNAKVPRQLREDFRFVTPAALALPGFRALLERLGVREPACEDVLNLLRSWSTSGQSTFSEGKLSETYTYLNALQAHAPSPVATAAMREGREPLIFVPHQVQWTKISQWKKGDVDSNVMHGKWIRVEDCCVRFLWPVPRQDTPWFSAMGAVRELEMHYAARLATPFETFGVREHPSLEQLARSIESAGRSQPPRVAVQSFATAARIWRDKYHLRQEEELSELRALFARYCATPTAAGTWVAWGSQEGRFPQAPADAVEVFFPPEVRPGQAVLSPEVMGYRELVSLYQALGMKSAMEAAQAPQHNGAASHGHEAAPQDEARGRVVVEASGAVELADEVERNLRVALAYIQIWLLRTHGRAYAACRPRAAMLGGIDFRISRELLVRGADTPAHFDGRAGVLWLAYKGRNEVLHLALRPLLRDPAGFALDQDAATVADDLAAQVLIRLAQANKPGLAAAQALARHGGGEDDPSSLGLEWWFREPPLPMEEPLPTMITSSGRGQGGTTGSDLNRPPFSSGGAAPGSATLAARGIVKRGGGEAAAGGGAGGAAGSGTAFGADAARVAAAVRAAQTAASLSRGGRPVLAGEIAEALARMRAWLQEHAPLPAEGDEAARAAAQPEDGDPWAEWARRRAQQVEDAVQEVEQLHGAGQSPGSAGAELPSFAVECRSYAAALRSWATTGLPPPGALVGRLGPLGGSGGALGSSGGPGELVAAAPAAAGPGAAGAEWAASQAGPLEELARWADHQGASFAAACHAHAMEMRDWASTGAPPGLQAWGAAPDLGPEGAPAFWLEDKADHLMRTVQAIQELQSRGEPCRADLASLDSQLRTLEALVATPSTDPAPAPASASSASPAAVPPPSLPHEVGQGTRRLANAPDAELVEDAAVEMPDPLHEITPMMQQDGTVGRWGEQWVYGWLKRKHAGSTVVVRWWNEASEQFRPYDISVEPADGPVEFVEVKSTSSPDKDFVEISEAEVLEAYRLQGAFTLIRVYGAGTRSAQMIRLPHLSSQWQTHQKTISGVELLARVPVPARLQVRRPPGL